MRTNAVNLKNLKHLFFSEVEGIVTQLYRSGPLSAVATQTRVEPSLIFHSIKRTNAGTVLGEGGVPLSVGPFSTSHRNSRQAVLPSPSSLPFIMSVSINNRFQGEKEFGLFGEERRLVENNREFLCD